MYILFRRDVLRLFRTDAIAPSLFYYKDTLVIDLLPIVSNISNRTQCFFIGLLLRGEKDESERGMLRNMWHTHLQIDIIKRDTPGNDNVRRFFSFLCNNCCASIVTFLNASCLHYSPADEQFLFCDCLAMQFCAVE